MSLGNNVLITGVAGFLGAHLAERHLNKGDVVYGVDNFSSSKRSSKIFVDLHDHENFLFAEMDICDKYEVVGLFEDGIDEMPAQFDLIYNFACPASPPIYQRIPIETLLTCTQGFANVLRYAREYNHRTVVVHASTSEVYGDPEVSVQHESYKGSVNSYGPRACYDEGKRAAEALAYDYLNLGLDVRLARIFNTYGPGMDVDDGRAVPNFVRAALKNETLRVNGTFYRRSFCYVDDLIDGVIALGALPNNPRSPVNIGNDVEIEIEELARLVLSKLPGASSRVEHVQPAVDDPFMRKPDLTLARSLLGYDPKVSLSDGLDRTIEWMREEVRSVQ